MWHAVDPALLSRCEATGTGIVAWAPLGRGFLAGSLTAVGADDFRTRVERLRGDNLAANNHRYRPIVALAAELGATPAQLALAWLLHRSALVVPIPPAARLTTSPRTPPPAESCSTPTPGTGSSGSSPGSARSAGSPDRGERAR
jgi:aryl-alcohol dehydrogenase-like predicted oxidoreductase